MDSFLVYCSICCWMVLSTDGVELTLEMSRILPLKGSRLELTCRISEPFNSNSIVVSKEASQVTLCYGDSYRCDFYKAGYSFSSSSTGVFGSISSLTTEAEGAWRCGYRSSGGDTFSNTWNVIVYTIPPGLSITQDPNQNVDLSVQSVVLQCKTTGCTHPMPTVQWIFQDQTTSSENIFKTDNPTEMQEMCDIQEKIYTSTLNLPLYTTLNDNIDKTGTFSCRIGYPDSSRNIIAHASNTVRFAVRVTEAVLQQNNQNITETLILTSAEPVTLTCLTGTSRPVPTIEWYIGSQMRGNGSSFTVTPSNMNHNETIYCKAYNTDSNSPVSSKKPRLYVKGPPQMVSKFSFIRFIENQIELQFEPGFNGDYIQTFVIQYKSTTDPDIAWKNSSGADLKETQIQLCNGICFVNVTQPSLGNYKYRMYSWNEKGRSPFSTEITVIFHEDAGNAQKGQAGPNIAGIAGGIGAAVVVIAAIIVVIIVIKRRNTSNGLSNNPEYDKSENHPSPSTRIGAVGTEYAVVVRHKHHPKDAMEEDPKVKICESATIPKRSTSQENVYENSNANVNSSGNNTYENPGDMAVKGPGVNKEGLLYADVILGPPTAKAGKPIIHGSETQTEYAEIAYGKRGEPLPESDKEKKNGGARKKNGTQMNIDE